MEPWRCHLLLYGISDVSKCRHEPLSSYLTISLPVATCPQLRTRCEGNHWGCLRLPTICLPFLYLFLTICLPVATCAQLRTRREGSHLVVAGGCVPFPYHFLTICLPIATCAQLRARCEGSHLVVAGGCLPFPYHFFASSLPFPYHLLTMHYMCKIENKM